MGQDGVAVDQPVGQFARLSGLWRPRTLSLVGTWRILFESRAMMRPMAETLGSAMSCRLHQGRSKTRSLALPRLGNCSPVGGFP